MTSSTSRIAAVALIALAACGGAETGSGDAAENAAPSKPEYMLGQFGAFVRANPAYEGHGAMQTMGGPLAVRIARVAEGRAFVMVLHTSSSSALEGWVPLQGRSLRFPIPDGTDCALTMERQIGEEERLIVTGSGACPAPWGNVPDLRKGLALKRTVEWWFDLRQGYYRPSFALGGVHEVEPYVSLSVEGKGAERRVTATARLVDELEHTHETPNTKVSDVTPSRLQLDPRLCWAEPPARAPYAQFLADGSFKLVGCPQEGRYFIDDPRSCAALNQNTCASQELLDARNAQPTTVR